MDEVDMVQRDPNDLNAHVKTQFEDIFGEPEGTQSIDCVWRNAFKCFTGGKNCCYKFITIICALPIALCWGCEFAMITFDHVWNLTPAYRSFEIYLTCSKRYFGACVHCICDPCCEAAGLLFSNIKIAKS
ncbi:caveolin-1-like [Lingula anatina]|uniref:Caveolin n=1 Tax=Lingula anatina TaxID=7574 RepID=A0A1S3IQQ3_LINAN|nr:caveolin-1-like [Lingula anatina]XP_013399874.1 caveolin-1-like [Lingula anatina]|eukprot:XP_013399601.1 caveolin-1-like [Lingula anatina]